MAEIFIDNVMSMSRNAVRALLIFPLSVYLVILRSEIYLKGEKSREIKWSHLKQISNAISIHQE